MIPDKAPSRGYLHEDFRLFRLEDTAMTPVDWHYHRFHKLLFFLSGHGGYAIEGQDYALEPGDLLLVPAGAIHRPRMVDTQPYCRFVLYLKTSFLEGLSSRETDLTMPFRKAMEQYAFALRPGREGRFLSLLEELAQAQNTEAFGQDLLCQALVTRLLVELTRSREDGRARYVVSASCDDRIVAILKYINLHLGSPISIESLARQFCISRYHMMRRFKAETGCTIHGYVTEKRLLLARKHMSAGMNPTKVSHLCGFGDYSTFSRAYRRRFGVSPSTSLPPESP